MVKNIVSCLFFVVCLAGCSTRQNMAIHPNTLSKPSTVVLAEISGLEKPRFLKEGRQGLLDSFINDYFASSISERVEKIDAKPITEEYFYKVLENELVSKSFKVTRASKILDKGSLSPPASDDFKFAPYDFSSLHSTYGTEYALILQPTYFGVQRNYKGFMPISKPYGVADLAIYMVRLKDNTVMGYYKVHADMPVAGEWDEPPHYPFLTQASKNALANALNYARMQLFNLSAGL